MGGMDPYGMSPAGQGRGGGKKGDPKKKKKASEDEPEMHAARGAGDEPVGTGTEPALPEDPLAIPADINERIGSDVDLEDQERGRTGAVDRHFYGAYYSESSGQYGFRMTLPPLWVERTQPSEGHPSVADRSTVYGMAYLRRRSARHADDVLFPLVWNLRDLERGERTTVVGPYVNRKTPTESDHWLAPLVFSGTRPNGGYKVIPPLLYYDKKDADGGFTLVGPAFCSYRGGNDCDTRSAASIDFGVVPLYFYGQTRERNYELIPPLLHYYDYNDRDLSWVNTWGPYYRAHSQERDLRHILPIYWSLTRPNGGRHTTVLPFFHYGSEKGETLFINPLYLLAKGAKGESTFVTWGYARHRGRTELDMITPFYWRTHDPDAGVDQRLLFPFIYSRTGPRESTQAFFPFWAHSKRYGISETTFITPFFQHTHSLTGFSTNIHPLVYVGRDGKRSHLVVAPFLFDIAGTESRATVVFPFYWRFSDLDSTTQLIGPVYYGEKKVHKGLDWQFHVFPFFSYGETPNGHWWNVLYGLAGYTRQGAETKARALWIPVPLHTEHPSD